MAERRRQQPTESDDNLTMDEEKMKAIIEQGIANMMEKMKSQLLSIVMSTLKEVINTNGRLMTEKIEELEKKNNELKDQVQAIKSDLTQQNHQQQQAPPSPTQKASASRTTKKQSIAAPECLPSEQFQDIEPKPIFKVSFPYKKEIKNKQKLGGFRNAAKSSKFMDKNTGIFTTPADGDYKFRGEMKMTGSGKCEWYICHNIWLGETESDGKKCTKSDGKECTKSDGKECLPFDVCLKCVKDMEVWLQVVPIGNVEVGDCWFEGGFFGDEFRIAPPLLEHSNIHASFLQIN